MVAAVPSSAQTALSQSYSREGPDWDREGFDWPNHDASRKVLAGGIQWHVQVLGKGPALLLLHGTGAATHSWRDLAPLLAKNYTVVAPDLPGHGFTEAPPTRQLSLPGMAGLLASLLEQLKMSPKIVAGHSAGAAIGAQMCLDRSVSPAWLVSLNGALMPLSGLPGLFFLPMAKFLANSPVWARIMANSAADSRATHRLLERTGSAIDERGTELYSRLLRNKGHTAAALGMMANWDLVPLRRRLPDIETAVALIVGDKDQMVPPAQAEQVNRMMKRATVKCFHGYGHLMHEEIPEEIAAFILALDASAEAESPA